MRHVRRGGRRAGPVQAHVVEVPRGGRHRRAGDEHQARDRAGPRGGQLHVGHVGQVERVVVAAVQQRERGLAPVTGALLPAHRGRCIRAVVARLERQHAVAAGIDRVLATVTAPRDDARPIEHEPHLRAAAQRHVQRAAADVRAAVLHPDLWRGREVFRVREVPRVAVGVGREVAVARRARARRDRRGRRPVVGVRSLGARGEREATEDDAGDDGDRDEGSTHAGPPGERQHEAAAELGSGGRGPRRTRG